MVGHGVATVWTGDGTGDYLYEILSSDAEHYIPLTDIGPISQKQLLEYLPQIVQSVRALHHAGFVHGSISPETIFVDGKKASKEHRRPSIIPSGIDNTIDEFGLRVEEYKCPHIKYKKKYIRILVSSMLVLSLVLLTTIPAFKAVLRLSATSYSPLYVRNIGMYISGLLLDYDDTGSLFVLVSALYSLIYTGASTIIALCSENTGGVFYVVACVAGHVAVLVLISLVLDLPIIVHLLIIFFFIWRRRTHS